MKSSKSYFYITIFPSELIETKAFEMGTIMVVMLLNKSWDTRVNANPFPVKSLFPRWSPLLLAITSQSAFASERNTYTGNTASFFEPLLKKNYALTQRNSSMRRNFRNKYDNQWHYLVIFFHHSVERICKIY